MTAEQKHDVDLRKESVDKAIVFLESRLAGDHKTMIESFKQLYNDIYNFISNKPYSK